jgi:glycosyltransferase involved in cell wall biosynthesis
VQNYVQGLAAGLSGLEGDDVYEFVGTRQQDEALAPFVSGATSFLTLPDVPWLSASTGSGLRSSRLVVRALETTPGRAARSLRRRARAARPVRAVRAAPLWPSPDAIEGGAYSVVHYAAPAGELTRHPNIYQPWDLQHIHFPEFFSREHLLGRERWRVCSERATYVLVASKFVRDDVITAYDVDPGRVAVVAPGVPTALHSAPPHPGPSDIPFALYPAQPWKHKNHLRLVDAIALLRDRGVDVRLVCPGPANPNQGEVRRRVAELGLGSSVQFPGFVSDTQLANLFQQARCLAFPSLFEGFGFPVLEAFSAGLPVTCSSTTSLPELAADAAVLFDPTDVEAMADAIERVWTDDGLRAQLIARGHERARSYSWDHLARSCRALYRAAAGESLGPGDDDLLKAAGVSA